MIIQFLITFLSILTNLLFWAIFINVMLSWFAQGRTGLGVMLDQIVRPILKPFRWARIGSMDFSPIVALIVIDVARGFLIRALYQLL